ncbi:MAG TPA: DUF5674 family protein [Rhabdochlamydiaceae bacterium]|jgi:hypothetical protein
MPTKIIEEQLKKADLLHLELKSQYGALIKAVVDVERAIMVAGMTMHADGEEILIRERIKTRKPLGNKSLPTANRRRLD